MNWKQVYITATRFERQQIAFMLSKHLHKQPPMTALRYHFIGSQYKNKRTQALYLGIFIFILITFSVGTWMVSLNVPPAYGAPCDLFWFVCLFAIFYMQPARRTRGHYSS